MKSGEIWICNNNCCFGEEREFPHYYEIISVKLDTVQYSLIDIANREVMPMMVRNRGDFAVADYDYMERKEFLHYHTKLRDKF